MSVYAEPNDKAVVIECILVTAERFVQKIVCTDHFETLVLPYFQSCVEESGVVN